MDDNLLLGLIASSKSPSDYAITGETLSVEPIAIMLRKDDPAFKTVVDDAVKALMKSGEMDKLYKKWFESAISPRGVNLAFPMTEATRNAIKNPNDAPAEAYNKK
jgi:glutamate/aspartate transport system substrate-binding protein